MNTKTLMGAASLGVALVTVSVAVAHAQPNRNAGPWQTYDTSNGEWRSYAGDIRGTKYSPLDQIDASNFSDLEVAWEWLSVDHPCQSDDARRG